ncbi:MAG: hypothetical protein HQ546_06230, partial [Planctomycetes bacterium]|nr:hypothetical protein [Planctomycetota bacterium]
MRATATENIESDADEIEDRLLIDTTESETQFVELWRPDAPSELPRGPESVLLTKGQITQDKLAEARDRQKTSPHLTVMQVLMHAGDIDETQALQAMAEYFKLPFVTLSNKTVDMQIFSLLPADFIRAKLAVPVRQENGAILVALSDPADIFLIDEVKRRLRRPVKLAVVTPGNVRQILDELAPGETPQIDEIIKDIGDSEVEVVESETQEVADLEKQAGESPVIRYVNYLITGAVKED